MAGGSLCYSKKNGAGLVLLLLLLGTGSLMGGADASCTVKNQSSKELVVVPVTVSVKVEIDVAVGVSVVVPTGEEKCKFRNKDSGHESGVVTLPRSGTVVIVDGAIAGTVDVCLGVYVAGLLTIGAKIIIGV